MPPKQKTKSKGSAPPNRIYKAVEPLHQTTFPEKKKRITRNYGKKSGVKFEKQDTLTQMDWVQLYEREEREDDIEDDIEDSEGDFEEEEAKRRTKRRRTMGDEPVTKGKKELTNRRKTLGEDSRTASFSTQTITQLDHWPLSGAPEEREEPEDDGSIYDIPVSSPPAVHPPRRSSRKLIPSRRNPRNSPQPDASAPVGLMAPPQTPRHRKILEIPSSQSPATPTSSQFGGSARKRSPLKEQSTNIAVPFLLRSKTCVSAEKLPSLKIEDTYETGTDESQVVRTPSKRSSPTKTVRFAVPDPSPESLADETPIKQEPATQRNFSPSPMRRRRTPGPNTIKLEILDSDAEDEDEESQVVADIPIENNSGYEDFTNPGHADENIIEEPEQNDEHSENDAEQAEIDTEKEVELPETFYGDIGAETQFHAERIMSSSSLSDLKENTPLSEDTPKDGSFGRSQSPLIQPSATQHTQTQHTQTQHTQFGKSQYPESQRLSTQQLDAMAPRSEASDIFISIYPTNVENIISRKKNHEFRSYNFPATVRRIWIYQTKPISTLTHMAVISEPKSPGEITNLEGLGNIEFNSGETRSKIAYEILELYALANPMTFEELKSRQWFRAAPQKYARVPPAVLGELIANLLPPLFTQSPSYLSPCETEASEDEHSTSIVHNTESQEVQDQITHNIQQYTQVPPPSSPPLASTQASEHEIHVPSSQKHFVRPSQASTVDYTPMQTQTPATPSHLSKESPIPDWIPESPILSIPSSSQASSPVQIQMLPPAVPRRERDGRINEIESQGEDEDEDDEIDIPILHLSRRGERRMIEIESESEDEANDANQEINNDGFQPPPHPHTSSPPQPYSLIRSSQLMTRSQMMRERDSLIGGEMMGGSPPSLREVVDSQVEDDDEDDDL
ncbi:hypothetical protein NHQ30_005819 [Ciborinia camelliae]|nr:hypothetical protein NHQ30_005819 [Ciborinia camelliae]